MVGRPSGRVEVGSVLAPLLYGAGCRGGGGATGQLRQVQNHYYAMRDVVTGEELLVSYGEFEDTNQQAWFDIKDDNDNNIEEGH